MFAVLGIPIAVGSALSYMCFEPESKSVRDNVVLITGTARGNGRELAMQFHRLGARVVCVDKDGTGNGETVDSIRAEGGRADGYTVDIADREQLAGMHADVRRRMGPVDVLVNNAAVVQQSTLFADPDADGAIAEIVGTNLLGQTRLIREILPSMLERNSGHIVTISSMMSFRGLPFFSTYNATKCAMNGMMESLTRELKLMNSDVITTTVYPYFVANDSDRSNQRTLRIPEMPLEDACEKIVEGILQNKRNFTIPDYNYYPLLLIRLLPENLQEFVYDIVYTNIKLTESEENIIEKYAKIAEASHLQESPAMFVPCMQMGSAPN